MGFVVIKIYRCLCLWGRDVRLLSRIHGAMEMKTPTASENVLLMLLLAGIIIISIILFSFCAMKIVRKVSATLEPQANQTVKVFEIRGQAW